MTRQAANRASNFFIRCPHCETKACVRTSKQETRTMRSLICQCTNALCGYTFVSALEAIRTISPSAMPNPEVNLPRSNHAKAMQKNKSLSSYQKFIGAEAKDGAGIPFLDTVAAPPAAPGAALTP